ncbi:MAG: hypothetical protein OXL96_28115 [Candidatus Poribacteria bacterium]|nr:hypothetical protein [Candidatus Poribacteria bacterium]
MGSDWTRFPLTITVQDYVRRRSPVRELPPQPLTPVRQDTPQTDLNHEAVLQFILDHEGALSRERGHGGYSNRGITQESWHAWLAEQGDQSHLPAEVRNATLTDSKRFYYDYFEKYHVWELHPALQLIYADFATLAGHQATRKVQEIVGTHRDGIWGVRTAAAVARFNTTLTTKQKQRDAFESLDSMKRAFFKRLGRHPEHKDDLPGWLQRADDVKMYMQPYFTNN